MIAKLDNMNDPEKSANDERPGDSMSRLCRQISQVVDRLTVPEDEDDGEKYFRLETDKYRLSADLLFDPKGAAKRENDRVICRIREIMACVNEASTTE